MVPYSSSSCAKGTCSVLIVVVMIMLEPPVAYKSKQKCWSKQFQISCKKKCSPFYNKGPSTHLSITHIILFLFFLLFAICCWSRHYFHSHISVSKRKRQLLCPRLCDVRGQISAPVSLDTTTTTTPSFFHLCRFHPPLGESRPAGSGERVGMQRRDLHRFKFVRENVEDVVELLVALGSVGLCARLTPEQPQGKLCPESLQQLWDRLPASCPSRCLISVYLILQQQQGLTAKDLYEQICCRVCEKKRKNKRDIAVCACVYL